MEATETTTTATGRINVQTENIFPIIKKFLYSDHEIFLRELVSNAVDATQKLRALSRMDKVDGDLGDLTIEVVVDKDAKTITIKDKGLGLSHEEVEKYITQIAFSGAEEWVKKYKDKAGQMIGHFGLGFYSAFMVASKVEIISKSYQKSKKAVHWSCDGSPEYTLVAHDRKERGTDIVLHIADDSTEFLENSRIEGILKKYCRFLPVSIKFGTRTETDWAERDDEGNKKGEDVKREVDNLINNPEPAWTKAPSALTDEDYLSFYRELYPMTFDEPLFHIHLNVDYPFNLTGILYFPKLKNNLQVQKDKIQLYCNQVFVTDSVEGIVPDFLTLLHGVIDSPDIPLNVSRSYLQSDSNVKKISSHITKKVADKLEEIFKNDRADLEKKWDDIKVFIQYGMLSDDKFYERATKFFLFKNVDGQYFTLEEYRDKVKDTQTDKDGRTVYLYTTDHEQQHTYLDNARSKGYDVLVMDSPLDAHFVNMLEPKLEKTGFSRVDADTMDRLIKKEDEAASKLSDAEKDRIKPLFEENLEKGRFTVTFSGMGEGQMPVLITQSEFMRRMNDMQKLSGQPSFMGGGLEFYNMVLNTDHPKVHGLLNEADEDLLKRTARQLIDIALLSQGLLKGEALTAFLKRSVEVL